MRKLKFRCWDKEEKKMYPCSSPWMGNVMVVLELGVFRAQPENDLEVMQFTGLEDKNGKDVYEGDIIKCGDNGENFPQDYDEEKDEFVDVGTYEVIGSTEDYPAFEIKPNPIEECNGLSQALATGYIEVIGNIYENPELLKGDKK
jgi:uncharacterized phage protein (TIGR01671 family)